MRDLSHVEDVLIGLYGSQRFLLEEEQFSKSEIDSDTIL